MAASSEIREKRKFNSLFELIDVVLPRIIAGIATQRKLRKKILKKWEFKIDLFFLESNEKKNFKFSFKSWIKLIIPNIFLDNLMAYWRRRIWNDANS